MRWPHVTARTIDEIEAVASVLLAIAFAHLLDARNISWAAFSGYMVMRGHVSDTSLRGLLRIVGTAAGVLLGLAIVPFVYREPPLAALSAAVIGGFSLYLGLTSKRSYAWLLVGVTFVMVLFDKVQNPAEALTGFAWTRLLEVVAGTAACVVVSAISTVTARRRWPAVAGPPARGVRWHPYAALHAAEGATALLLLPLVGWLWPLPNLAQAAVTMIAVMLLPLSAIELRGLMPVTTRMALRVAGCFAGAALAFLILLFSHHPVVLFLGIVIGVAIGRHIENGQGTLAYSGVQFALALLIVLVPDNYSRVAVDPAYGRLLGIVIGIVLLQPVLLLWYAIFAGLRMASPRKAGESVNPGNAE